MKIKYTTKPSDLFVRTPEEFEAYVTQKAGLVRDLSQKDTISFYNSCIFFYNAHNAVTTTKGDEPYHKFPVAKSLIDKLLLYVDK